MMLKLLLTKQFNILINLKYPTIAIGICYAIILIFRTYEIAVDIYVLEELVEVGQLTYIILITILQILMVTVLFVGAIKENHLLILPWLCFTTPMFIMATGYSFLYVSSGDISQIILNFIVIAIFWFSWYVIFKYYAQLKMSNKHSAANYTNYKYSQLNGIPQAPPQSLPEINSVKIN